MENYEDLILEKIKGESPKEKYETLTAINELLSAIAFPRRGTEEENLDIFKVSEIAATLLKTH